MINCPLPVTVPAIAHDMLGAILDLLAAYYGMVGEVTIIRKPSFELLGTRAPERPRHAFAGSPVFIGVAFKAGVL